MYNDNVDTKTQEYEEKYANTYIFYMYLCHNNTLYGSCM